MTRLAFSGLSALLLLTAASAAHADTAAATPARQSALIVYGNDPCPKGEGDEIVVCAREPESERYRIPKKLRKTKPDETGARSWSDRVPVLEEASRPQRPNSCTTVGASGQTGCTQAMLRQWFAERRAVEADNREVP
ncbi:hypothetical protein [Sphingomonas solaris]|uniref:DUF4124 domain-containing protein n=1 Tax=Alterirhizorhabdus solaris TaxID=2529389 RepID=A0A558RAA1_9SPHN|nr:hypothetical protein [Sphingomonas solaris]TVV76309.1 hypothetical protein FOY91_04535 [Sphingomonas solaris]